MSRRQCPCCHMSELEARRLLSEAAWSGKTEEARYLIKKHFKGRLAKMDEETLRALEETYEDDEEKCEEQKFVLEFPVLTAVERGHEEVAIFLLGVSEGNAVELVDHLDRPLLLRAARRGMAGMVRALAALGCDVAEDDHRKGHTALCMAARSGSVETIRAVVDLFSVSGRCLAGFVHGCPVKNLLQHAIKGDHVDMCKYLCEHLGFSLINSCWGYSRNFLLSHYAAQFWRTNCLRWLIKEGGLDVEARADLACAKPHCLDCVDFKGMTVLHMACADRKACRQTPVLDVVRMLVEECGADKGARTRSGKTAAELSEREEVKDYLLAEQKAKAAEAAAAALLAELEAEEARELKKKSKSKKKKGKAAAGNNKAAPEPAPVASSSTAAAAAAAAPPAPTVESLVEEVAAVRLEEEKGEGADGKGGGGAEPEDEEEAGDGDEEEEGVASGSETKARGAAAATDPPAPPQAEPELEKQEEDDRPYAEEEAAFVHEGAPEHMLCALTRQLAYDARIASDGFTYQRAAIEQYIAAAKASGEKLTSPMTKEPLAEITIPNHLVRQTVLKFIEQRRRELRALRP